MRHRTPLFALCTALLLAAPLTALAESAWTLPSLLPPPPPQDPNALAHRLVLAAAGDSAATAAPAMTAPRASGPSPRKAFFLSALLPGSGELFAGSKARAAVFFGLEVAGWGAYLNWKGKGDDLEEEFRARADTTWNPWNYLAWSESSQARHTSKTHELPCDSLFAAAPTSTPVPQVLSGCSSAETQQYYELIGKYDQFIAGWADVSDGFNRVHYTDVDSAEHFVSETRLSYEDQRNESNKYLKRASNVGGLLLVNHVFSAIDAARVARARRLGQDEAVIERRTRFGVALGGSSGRTPLVMAWRPFD